MTSHQSALSPTPARGATGPSVDFNSATANAWARCFLAHLRAALADTALQRPQHWHAEIARNAQARFNQHPAFSHAPCLNPAAQTNTERSARVALGACALALACYQTLTLRLRDRSQALGITQRCFDASYRAFVAHVCVPLYREHNQQPQALSRINLARWSAHLYPGLQATGSCGYAVFFRHHGAGELADMVRSADSAWQRTAARLTANATGSAQGTRVASPPANPGATLPESGFSPFHFAVERRQTRRTAPHRVCELVVAA